MLDNIKPKEYPELAEKCKDLFNKIKSESISEDEFLKQVALLAIQDRYGFNELNVRQMPTIPEELKEYRKMNYPERRKFLEKRGNFFIKGRVAEYLEAFGKIKNNNKSNKVWLENMRTYLSDCPKALEKINNRLEEFINIQDDYQYQQENNEYLKDKNINSIVNQFDGVINDSWDNEEE